MSGPLDEQYLTWLYSQVSSVKLKNPARTYWSLLRQLYTKEFVWLVPNDDNRVEDGRDLRYEFLAISEMELDQEWLGLPCSMLEMLIGLSRRLAFDAGGEPRGWFWHMLENVELNEYSDRFYDNYSARHIDEILERVIWRKYSPNGRGGLFPLRRPTEDQTREELWYQFNAYILERG